MGVCGVTTSEEDHVTFEAAHKGSVRVWLSQLKDSRQRATSSTHLPVMRVHRPEGRPPSTTPLRGAHVAASALFEDLGVKQMGVIIESQYFRWQIHAITPS